MVKTKCQLKYLACLQPPQKAGSPHPSPHYWERPVALPLPIYTPHTFNPQPPAIRTTLDPFNYKEEEAEEEEIPPLSHHSSLSQTLSYQIQFNSIEWLGVVCLVRF